jgi:amino acid adenylation domain-containing protein
MTISRIADYRRDTSTVIGVGGTGALIFHLRELLHARFKCLAAKRLQAILLSCGGDELSYSDLVVSPPLPAEIARAPKNPLAVLVVASPRSGTTLLRGQPALLAPPELELVEFDTPAERRDALLEGVLHAVMEARACGPEEAREAVAGLEEKGTTTRGFYGLLQQWIGGRTLVDRTPTYAWSPETLRRAESSFEETRCVHLLRHPYAAIASFEEARIEQVFFPRTEGFTRCQLTELSWLLAQRNIHDFLAAIPAERRHVVRFEELVAAPERVLRELCDFLGLFYHPDMGDPYKDRSVRMTDGLHAESRMLGDVKFHQQSGVDAKTGERWHELAAEGFRGEESRRLAAELGYEAEPEREAWTAIPRAAADGPLPLSFAQERLWFLDRLEPGTSTYNLVNALRLTGRLDTAALERALAEVVRRHAVLRTTFTETAETAGGPVQVVAPEWTPPLPLTDLAAVPADRREAEARQRIEAEADRPFDLERGPLVRALLLRLAPEDHAVALSLHHIVSDGWSMGVLVAEVAALYAAFAQGRPSPMPELPIQYGDFAVWQRRRLDGALAAQLAWWRERLHGVPPLDLPLDHLRPPAQTFRGAHVPVALPADLSAAVAALGAGERATVFMTLLAGFAVLLHRYSGQSDLIGFFVNTLALRMDAAGEPGFRGLLARVREAAIGAFAHREVPFERVVEELRPERDLARSPLFQVMFILQNNVSGPLTLPGLTLSPYAFETTAAKFELTLSLFEGADGLVGSIEYNTDLFDGATVERMAGHFGRLLASAVAAPDRPVGELPMLAGPERAELLTAWNDTARPREAGLLVHELFARQAQRTPDAVAVAQGSVALTYRQLDERSNRLARRLRRLGVGPEVRVGLCLERTPEMVVALLGILKAGGAYVPLDPSHPAERLGMVIEDSALPVLVTEEGLLGSLPAHSAVALCLDRDDDGISAETAASLDRLGDEESLAYVIYTSGSTGQPKGVQLPHRAVVNFLLAMAERPGLGAADVVPALTTISFDIAGLEIYLPLAVGGRVEMLSREEAADGRLLAARLAACGATLVQATPATWRLLLDAGWQGIPGLRALCGGEALPRDLAASLLARGVELWNVYGPTETAVWSAVGEVAPGEGTVLLGEPVANTRFYVVDRALQPVPVGVPGELWIAGDGVARGYLERPELTAERFAPDPFAAEPGSRLYRTGDLVRYRLGGALEFLGRIDHQVKIRGYRIELGEIEAALLRHPAVKEAVAAVRDDGGEKRLVAHLVADGESAPGALREHLKLLLPDYMVPAAFVTLESFPLTPSGKVDRKALPAPEITSTPSTYLAPSGPVEELVAAIWAEVLRVERIGVEDNFFDLGGHSLLATQVMSRLRAALGVELPLQRLFETPTVRALIRALEAARREGMEGWLPPITPAPRRDRPLPLSFAQERMWFLHQLDPALTAYNLVQLVRLRGALDVPVLERALDGVFQRHESLRTVFAAGEYGPRQIVRPPAPVRLVCVDLRQVPTGARDQAIERCALAMTERPFDLVAGPLFQVALLQLAADDAVLVVLMHHIVSDGWSIRLMVSELAALYAADREGLPSPLPELAIQYADFAVWQRRWLTGERLAGPLDYWRRQLAGAPPLLELPTDRPRPALQSSRGSRRPFEVAAATARQVAAIGRSRGLTPFMTLLAAFEALLWRYTGAADLLVGVPIANRTRAEVENLIGTFVNMLVLRTRLPAGGPAFAELASQVREVSLAAFAYQDLPFEKLVDELRPERSLSYSPLFQVMFNLQNQPVATMEVPGLSFVPLSAVRTQAQVDLTLALGGVAEGEGLVGFFEFNSDLFDAVTVDRMAAHFTTLLAGAVAAPEQPIVELPLLAPGELRQLVTEWSDTAVERPAGRLIHELFVRQAAALPGAPAVSCGGAQVLSYGELDACSNRLANHLRHLGVGPEVRVALCLERTPEMVVALLGVLKAGGAYVPLDPGHPAERLALVLADAGPAVLLTEERWLAALPPHGARTVCLDRDAPAIAAAGDAALPPAAGDESLAYVIYTSGSTGRPKGVQLPHRAVVNFLLAMAARPGLTGDDVVPALTTLTFDIAGLEIYLPLAVGGRIEMVPREEAVDGVRLAARLAASGATVLQATPATWRLLLDAGWQGSPGLKALCGGEALPRELAAALLERVGELWNVYGPTETAVWSARPSPTPGSPW